MVKNLPAKAGDVSLILWLGRSPGKGNGNPFQQIWKTQQWPQDHKRSVFISIPKKGNAKECSNYCTVALISHTSIVKALNSPREASTVGELRTSRCSSWI